MKYGSQFSPVSGTRDAHINLPSREIHEVLLPDCNDIKDDIKLFRSWMVYDSHLESRGKDCSVNWNGAFGLALTVTLSVIFWVGLGSLILRLWK